MISIYLMAYANAVIYRVTIHVVPNLLLKSKQKFHFSMRYMYKNTNFVLVSTGG